MNTFNTFKTLHQSEIPLLLANIWDVHTAKLAQQAGYKALGTSSHAMANSLGFEDGENISFEQLYFMIKHIMNVAKIPVSVDFEAGYSDDPEQVAKYIKQLTDIGIAGINLEDGKVKDGKRILGDYNLLVEKIKAIKAATTIFINARIDTYTTQHPDSLNESISRASTYKVAGADGVFVPLIEKDTDILTFTSRVDLPLNVFATPNLPNYEVLKKLGVKRISHGAKQYELLMSKSEEIFSEFIKTKDYKVVLG
ncbi:MAG: isocitrate lyase/phosphoenolpyruvate mutase family protein [Flavobacteriaceae bacterium]